MTPKYPEGLPLGLHSGRIYQLESPLQRTELSSGRARQRRRFTSVPQYAQISWLFNSLQARAFEAWWRDALVDGALWFLCPLQTVLGLEDYDCRFTGVYNGPSRVGPDLWSITAELELRERAALPADWGLYPEIIIGSSIFDKAMNREWPRYVNYGLLTEDSYLLTTEDGFGLTTE